jgi:ABC-2 type transport system ATP-binding protein
MYSIETFGITKHFKKERRNVGWYSWIFNIYYMLQSSARRLKPDIITAVDDLTLKVKEREIFGLIGPNGAGKTTFVKLLCTLLLPDAGTALVQGYDILAEPEKVKDSVNLIATTGWYIFDFSLSLEENLEYYAALYGLPPAEGKRRAKEALGFVGLSEWADESPMNLSSGMRQRLILAKGFLVDAPILFMDEPTIGLDPKAAKQIRALIRVMSRQQEHTVFFTSHYMNEVEELCDRVALMNHGKLVVCGAPRELKQGLQKTVITEITALNIDPEVVQNLNRINEVTSSSVMITEESIGRGIIRLHSRGGNIAGSALEVLNKMRVKVQGVRLSEPTMEDVFMRYTGERELD